MAVESSRCVGVLLQQVLQGFFKKAKVDVRTSPKKVYLSASGFAAKILQNVEATRASPASCPQGCCWKPKCSRELQHLVLGGLLNLGSRLERR